MNIGNDPTFAALLQQPPWALGVPVMHPRWNRAQSKALARWKETTFTSFLFLPLEQIACWCTFTFGRDKPLLTVVYDDVRSYSSGPGSHTVS